MGKGAKIICLFVIIAMLVAGFLLTNKTGFSITESKTTYSSYQSDTEKAILDDDPSVNCVKLGGVWVNDYCMLSDEPLKSSGFNGSDDTYELASALLACVNSGGHWTSSHCISNNPASLLLSNMIQLFKNFLK